MGELFFHWYEVHKLPLYYFLCTPSSPHRTFTFMFESMLIFVRSISYKSNNNKIACVKKHAKNVLYLQGKGRKPGCTFLVTVRNNIMISYHFSLKCCLSSCFVPNDFASNKQALPWKTRSTGVTLHCIFFSHIIMI